MQDKDQFVIISVITCVIVFLLSCTPDCTFTFKVDDVTESCD